MAKRINKKLRLFRTRVALVKIAVFFLVWLLLALIGLCWFLRPTTSEVERRTLTTFPAFSLSGIWDGSWFSDVDTWYADTYPLRDGMISLSDTLKSHYGLQTEELVGVTQTADEIPEGDVDLEALAQQDTQEEVEAQPEEEEEEEIIIPEVADQEINAITTSIYATDDAAYGIYYFGAKTAARYSLAVNALAQNLEGIATVYNLIAPVSGCIMLSEDTWASIDCSDAQTAIEFMQGNMIDSVVTVNPTTNLLAHRDEYIYFRTDHHWTALGAYYAYQTFCKAKGITPNDLDSFETMTFDGFLGTFYSYVSKSISLKADTVVAYIPNGTNICTSYMREDDTYVLQNWKIVNNVSNYSVYYLYATFAAGDQPLTWAHNESVTDGSSILVIKDSYGNALIPFLIDHYEYIYWIDFRYWSAFCEYMEYETDAISWYVQQEGIDEVLIINNLSSANGSELMSYMEDIFR